MLYFIRSEDFLPPPGAPRAAAAMRARTTNLSILEVVVIFPAVVVTVAEAY